MSQNESPRKNKTKEEIEADMKRGAEVKRLRALVKDSIYPAVVDASLSIDDAKFLLHSFSSMMMDKFLESMKEVKFVDLKLVEKLDPASPKHADYVKLLALFENETVFTARELIEGMKMEIEMMISNEMKERKLDTLKTNFL